MLIAMTGEHIRSSTCFEVQGTWSVMHMPIRMEAVAGDVLHMPRLCCTGNQMAVKGTHALQP